jgi:hypothetical protein
VFDRKVTEKRADTLALRLGTQCSNKRWKLCGESVDGKDAMANSVPCRGVTVSKSFRTENILKALCFGKK